MNEAFSPFHDSPPNKEEREYLRILHHHHEKFIIFKKYLINKENIKTAIEIGSYLTNVACRLKKYVDVYVATDIDLKKSRNNYKEWAKSKGLNTDVNEINDQGLFFLESNKRYDALLASEILEHLPYNPVTVINSFKKYINIDGIIIISIPNRLSLGKIFRFMRGMHPYIFFETFTKEDYIENKFSHHWLEYNIKDLDYIFNHCGFKNINSKKSNLFYGNKILFSIKNLVKIITLGKVYDQIYAAYKLK
ncbi:hypothetical protein [Polynucleobacter sp. AP-Reno-20A-A9]|uniref:hypothetical protein n=1 Tax=Polynucleobacter sp. AP-Reno-20A-A9 TaxID=2576925 RepID=UPI001C0BB851|nr:hypothetical protein [Polynucleobacter sp. AP-Reno-20A-A9]MBU3629316.1 hypothetical protein [Polynucleobacter sp. AP-Reno-20A-A9]